MSSELFAIVFACAVVFVPLLILDWLTRKGDGCFHGSNRILMGNGTMKACKDIVKGDSFKMGNGRNARVVCVVKILKTHTNDIRLVKFPCGLVITEYHPVCIKGAWAFPKNISSLMKYTEDFDAVYSFLVEMEDGSNVDCGFIVEGVECAPLGHDIKGDVIEHAFFGNKTIVKDSLLRLNPEEFSNGLVHVTKLKRDFGGMVVDFLYDS